MVLVGHMHQLFNPDLCVLDRILCYLLELDQKVRTDGDPQSLLASIKSILMHRSYLARVCRDWSKLFSNTQTLSLASLHLNAFGCYGKATEIFAKYTTVRRRVADTIAASQHMDCSILAQTQGDSDAV